MIVPEVLAWRVALWSAWLDPVPAAPWAVPPDARVVLAWETACTLRAVRLDGVEVTGRGARVMVSRGQRRAVIDHETRTWTANGRPVRWRAGTEGDLHTLADVLAWLMDGVEPEAWGE